MSALKRTVLILLALIMTFSVFSCNKSENDPTPPEQDRGFNPYPYDDLSVFMSLPDYKSITISRSEIDKKINQEIAFFLESNQLYVQAFDRRAEKWDRCKIDYVGMLNGEAFAGGTANDAMLTLGSETFIDGFEIGVIGMGIGETRDIKLKFPDQYHASDLAGKDVVFTVTLKEIWESPEIDEAFCQKYTLFDTPEEYYAAIEKTTIFDHMWNVTLNQCVIKSRPQEYTDYYRYFVDWFTDTAANYGMKLEDFLKKYGGNYSSYGIYNNMPLTEFYRLAENYAESNLANDLLFYSLLRAENITTEGEEFEKAKATLEKDNNMTYDQLVAEYGEETAIISILNILLADAMLQYITITE